MSQPLAVSIKNLTKSYGSLKVLDNLELSIKPGKIFGIVGRSGAGKTTLINCLLGLEKPSEGLIQVMGTSLANLDGPARRKALQRLGVVFQNFQLFLSRTVAENVAYPFEIASVKPDVEPLLEQVGLLSKASTYPAFLSGGQKQRVAIARALALKPDLLILDEPTSALDPHTAKELMNLLKELNQKLGVTLLIITHDLDLVCHCCHEMALLDKGRVVEQGKVIDLMVHSKHPQAAAYFNRLPENLPDHLKLSGPDAEFLSLLFPPSCVNRAVLSQMIVQFDVQANILLGSIDVLAEGQVGNLFIELVGDETKRLAAKAFLSDLGIVVRKRSL